MVKKLLLTVWFTALMLVVPTLQKIDLGATYIPGFVSMQSGNVQVTGTNLSGTATISAVNMGSTILVDQGFRMGLAGDEDAPSRLELTNATTVTAYRGTADSASTLDHRFTALEFNSALIKSMQVGTITIGAGSFSNTQTVSSVNTLAYILVYTGFEETSLGVDSLLLNYSCRLVLTDAVTITADRGSNSGGTKCGYMLMEKR